MLVGVLFFTLMASSLAFFIHIVIDRVIMPKVELIATPEIIDILARSTLDQTGLVLPEKLLPKLYREVDKYLKIAGFKWEKRQQRHVAQSTDAMDRIKKLIDDGSIVDEKKLYQAYYTPKDVAKQVIALAELEVKLKVLEPSAGMGALVKSMLDLKLKLDITCIDIDPRAVERLRELYSGEVDIWEDDFLKIKLDQMVPPFYDRIVMNPPFTTKQDAKHILHAWKFLKPSGILVSIVSLAHRFRSEGEYQKLGKLIIDYRVDSRLLPAGSFRESGTNIPIEIIVLKKPEE